jgi:Skp family chaperone for outer membrane proteins
MARSGRGWLNAFDLLPSEADEIVAWAARELAGNERTQTDIYAEFVTRCQTLMAEHRGEIEFRIPSFSAFNRYSVRQARLSRRLEQTREIVAVLAEKHDAKASDDLTVITGEMIKSLVLHMLGDAAEGMVPKDLLDLAGAFAKSQQAQNLSADRKAKEQARLAARVTEAVDTVAKAKGMTADTAEAIKASILGITK